MFKRNVTFVVIFVFFVISVTSAMAQEEPFVRIYGVNAIGNVNLRGNASTSGALVGNLQDGQQVTIIKVIEDGQPVNSNSVWYQIEIEGIGEAYVWSGAMSDPVVIDQHCAFYTEFNLEPDHRWLAERKMSTKHESLMHAFAPDIPARFVATSSEAPLPNTWNILLTYTEALALFNENSGIEVSRYLDETTCQDTNIAIMTNGYGLDFFGARSFGDDELTYFRLSDLASYAHVGVDNIEDILEDILLTTLEEQAPLRNIARYDRPAEEVFGYTPYDAENNPRWQLVKGLWVDLHPGRSEYESALPDVFFEMFGDNISWDSDYVGFRRDDNLVFRSHMGIVKHNETFVQSDIERGWVREVSRFNGDEITIIVEISVAATYYEPLLNPIVDSLLSDEDKARYGGFVDSKDIEVRILESMPWLRGKKVIVHSVGDFLEIQDNFSRGYSETAYEKHHYLIQPGEKQVLNISEDTIFIRLASSGGYIDWGSLLYEVEKGTVPCTTFAGGSEQSQSCYREIIARYQILIDLIGTRPIPDDTTYQESYENCIASQNNILASSRILFTDDFSSSNLSERWFLTGDGQITEINLGTYAVLSSSDDITSLEIAEGNFQQNYSFSFCFSIDSIGADIYTLPDNAIEYYTPALSLQVRKTAESYYNFAARPDPFIITRLELDGSVDGKPMYDEWFSFYSDPRVTVTDVIRLFRLNRWYNMRIDVVDNQLSAYIDGVQRIQFNEDISGYDAVRIILDPHMTIYIDSVIVSDVSR